MRPIKTLATTIALALSAAALHAQASGDVAAHAKISATQGGFGSGLDDVDAFGIATAALPDLDGDGVPELAAGAIGDDDGGSDRGAEWIVFLHADGSVKAKAKVSDTQGGFAGVLDDNDWFGFALASLGDVDDNGVADLAAGANHDGDGGVFPGAVWLLFLAPDGTVKSHGKISATAGFFAGVLDVK